MYYLLPYVIVVVVVGYAAANLRSTPLDESRRITLHTTLHSTRNYMRYAQCNI
jgi:hypothetical protein